MKHAAILTVSALVLCFLCLMPTTAVAQCYEFSDSTRQGWIPGDPFGTGFNGILEILYSGGNPGPWIRAFDDTPFGAGLAVRAPTALSGNLVMVSLFWDEFIPDDPRVRFSTACIIKGTDGTIYQSDRTLQGVGVWAPRMVSFADTTGWDLMEGTTEFFTVAENVAALYIQLEVVAAAWFEAGIDNICLSEEPIPVERTTWGSIKVRFKD